MGAPDHGSPYVAPPVVQPSYAPPEAYSPQPGYETGSVVAMAPIPNPGDPGSAPYYAGERAGRIHAHYDNGAPAMPPVADNYVKSPYGEGHPAPGRHPTYTYPAPVAPAAPAYTPPAYTAPKPVAPVYAKAAPVYKAPVAPPYRPPVVKAPVYTAPKPVAPVYAKASPTVKSVEHKGAAVMAAAGAAAGVMAIDAKHDAKVAANTAVQTYKAKAPVPAPLTPPAASGDRTANLATLQTTLTDTVGKTAVLTAPARFTANQPADVSLTIPAGFADTLHGEAQKDGLGDAAASVNMTALLSGDGFSVTPDDTQSAPLTTGQPTEFHWTVTAMAGAKGPLHADVGADLLGGGSDKLALGSVQKAAGMGIKLTPRVIGASLLVLIAALVVAWLARGRGPTRSVAARRASRRAARGGRPVDMGSGPVDETTAL